MPKKKAAVRKWKKSTFYLDPAALDAVERLVGRYSAASASEAVRRGLKDLDSCFDYLCDQGKLTRILDDPS